MDEGIGGNMAEKIYIDFDEAWECYSRLADDYYKSWCRVYWDLRQPEIDSLKASIDEYRTSYQNCYEDLRKIQFQLDGERLYDLKEREKLKQKPDTKIRFLKEVIEIRLCNTSDKSLVSEKSLLQGLFDAYAEYLETFKESEIYENKNLQKARGEYRRLQKEVSEGV